MHSTDDECPGELDEVQSSSPVVKRPSVTLLETPRQGPTAHLLNPLTKDEAVDPEFDLVDIELARRRSPPILRWASRESAIQATAAKRPGLGLLPAGVVLGTFLAAVAVPDLGALIALLGALTGSILSLIAPALINRRCPREKGGWECVADGMTILIGVIGGTLGTYQAFLNVVNGGDISE